MADPTSTGVPGSVSATSVLTVGDERVQAIARSCRAVTEEGDGFLQAAHHEIAELVRPVYAMDEMQPVAKTLDRGRGSCAQRMAVLEAVARAGGMATRVRGLIVAGEFWKSRFRPVAFLVPTRVPLAWPEFQIDETWTPFGELFASTCGVGSAARFTNRKGETLFDAASAGNLSWSDSSCGLSEYLIKDCGLFTNREDFHATHGLALPVWQRVPADLLLSRWSSM